MEDATWGSDCPHVHGVYIGQSSRPFKLLSNQPVQPVPPNEGTDGGVDIAHLTFRPPFASGSYNRFVAQQIARLPEFRQVAISFWQGRQPSDEVANEAFLLVSEAGLSVPRRAYLSAPERIHRFFHNGIGDRKALAYLWGVQRELANLKPRLVICYDGYKYGALLRRTITWPCRLVLAQCGLSYRLPTTQAASVYGFESFDAIWALSLASYRHDRHSLNAYIPAVTVIPNGVDTEIFSPPTDGERRESRKRWNLPEDRLVVLVLGRLVPKKGVHLALQCWHQIVSDFPNAFLWIVGDGPADYRRHLEQLAQATGVRNSVRFQGSVSPQETSSCFRAADVYLFPTLASEGMANSLIEAMACGLPCIASDDASALEHFAGAVVFVPDVNVEGRLLAPLRDLLAGNESRRHWGALARARVEERFDACKIFSALRSFFTQQLLYAS